MPRFEQIISPNNWEYYLKMNPTCGEPKIQVSNTGKNVIKELGLKYGVVGGKPYNVLLERQFIAR